jgi:hypothetical protein
VKVMTYNVLKSTCSFSFYPHCDTQHMLFPYRYPSSSSLSHHQPDGARRGLTGPWRACWVRLANQAREIEALAPDVACLQVRPRAALGDVLAGWRC